MHLHPRIRVLGRILSRLLRLALLVVQVAQALIQTAHSHGLAFFKDVDYEVFRFWDVLSRYIRLPHEKYA